MASYTALHHPEPPLLATLNATLRSFPIAGFTLALASDLAYIQTSNLLWLHFAEWLLFAGIVGGGLAFLVAMIDFAVSRRRPSWWAVLAVVGVLVLALANNFVHTADGWTAVMPMGVTLSALTVAGMLVAALLANVGVRHE